MEILKIILASAVVSSIISAIISLWTKSKDLKSTVVIEERRKWREFLRESIPKFLSLNDPAQQSTLKESIALRLNPYDQRDIDALTLLDKYIDKRSKETAQEITYMFSEILKHDWERVKIEASLFPWNSSKRASKRIAKQKE